MSHGLATILCADRLACWSVGWLDGKRRLRARYWFYCFVQEELTDASLANNKKQRVVAGREREREGKGKGKEEMAQGKRKAYSDMAAPAGARIIMTGSTEEEVEEVERGEQ